VPFAALGWTAMRAKPNKTQANDASVETFLAGIEPDGRRADAAALAALMAKVSGEPPRMWGPSVIGFGVRRYRYESGREGEICQLGFSPRKGAFALYVTARRRTTRRWRRSARSRPARAASMWRDWPTSILPRSRLWWRNPSLKLDHLVRQLTALTGLPTLSILCSQPA
jgi:hypothetical protein